MARRVRFIQLTLTGFGRYDRPTRFSLGGSSCTYTAANELGKSTFLTGLLATLFGPPVVRSKLRDFQKRYRSWTKPDAFWGELDFTVADESWRVRRDFDQLDVQVWRVLGTGLPELRYRGRARARRAAEADGYLRHLDDWLGMSDRSVYEAMFTLSQRSRLAEAWQIDPHVSARVYGQAVERLGGSLQAMYERFRSITRATREHGVVVGTHGARGGRGDGRLEQLAARASELELELTKGREWSGELESHRVRLAELERHVEQLRAEAEAASSALDNWRAWEELEARLRPAVASYERLRTLNDRCQEAARSLADIRTRLAGELSSFAAAPHDLADRLEYHTLLGQALTDARTQHTEATCRRQEASESLGRLRARLAADFAELRGRPELADQLADLRWLNEELARERTRACTAQPPAPQAVEDPRLARRAVLGPWKEIGPDWRTRLNQARECVAQFVADQRECAAAQSVIPQERDWLAKQSARVAQLAADRDARARERERRQAAMAAAAERARNGRGGDADAKQRLEASRRDVEHRFADFRGAPDDLPELWGRLHACEHELAAVARRIAEAEAAGRRTRWRAHWRWGLSGTATMAVALCLVGARGWLDWLGAALAALLAAAVQWLYRPPTGERPGDLLRALVRGRDLRRGERDELRARLGPRFLVPPEREIEWRRLWPSYRRELERLEAEARSLPTPEQIAEHAAAAAESERALSEQERETAELLREADRELERYRAELERRTHELKRLEDLVASHAERYFGTTGSDWERAELDALPAWWQTVLHFVAADAAPLAGMAEFVRWCEAQDDDAWSRFADCCAELEQLETDMRERPQNPRAFAEPDAPPPCDDPAVRSLEDEVQKLRAAIAPFGDETDADELRARIEACRTLEAQSADAELELECLPDPEPLRVEQERLEAEHAEASALLAPFLERFASDPQRALTALAEHATLTAQAESLGAQVAALVAESGCASANDLAHEAGKAEGLVATVRASAQELLERSAELWQAVDAPPEQAAQRIRDLETQASEARAALEAAERERAEQAAALRQKEAAQPDHHPRFVAELEALRAEQATLETERAQIAAEFQEANRLKQELERIERTALEGRITAYFADFSRTAGRRVELDEELRVWLVHGDGSRYAPEQLSHGARDQLCLAVYLATSAGFDLPFVLDDPFVNCDAERLAAIRSCWDRLVPDHQLILLSHDTQLACWAPALNVHAAA